MPKSADRRARLASALRANLKRRKANTRVKAGQCFGGGDAAPDDAAKASTDDAARSAPHPRPNMAQKVD